MVFAGASTKEGRTPCYIEGPNQPIAWLTQDKIHAEWRPFRPAPDRSPRPAWLTEHEHVRWVTRPEGPLIQRVLSLRERSGWFVTSSCVPTGFDDDGREMYAVDAMGEFDWAIQRYATGFWRFSDFWHHFQPIQPVQPWARLRFAVVLGTLPPTPVFVLRVGFIDDRGRLGTALFLHTPTR